MPTLICLIFKDLPKVEVFTQDLIKSDAFSEITVLNWIAYEFCRPFYGVLF